MKVSGSFLLVLVNPTSEQEFTNLGQTSLFLLSDLQQGTLDFARDSEPNPFVLGSHNLRGF